MEKKQQHMKSKTAIIFIICGLIAIIAMSKYTEHRQSERIKELEIISLDLAHKLKISYMKEYQENLTESIVRQEK